MRAAEYYYGCKFLFFIPDGSIASLTDDQEQLLFDEFDLENTEEYRKKIITRPICLQVRSVLRVGR